MAMACNAMPKRSGGSVQSQDSGQADVVDTPDKEEGDAMVITHKETKTTAGIAIEMPAAVTIHSTVRSISIDTVESRLCLRQSGIRS